MTDQRGLPAGPKRLAVGAAGKADWEDQTMNEWAFYVLDRLRLDVRGATAIEYALIAAFIGLVIVGAVTALGGSVGSIFQQVSDGF
jgi:pilus assembly protein Flp/PilA